MQKPIQIYNDHIEPEALSQFYNAMSMDFAIKGVLMPDAHAGYALPIGAVVATQDVIVPAWVGYDIGCGMCAVPITFSYDSIVNNAQAIFKSIYNLVSVGFNHNAKEVNTDFSEYDVSDYTKTVIKDGALRQLGTLGSGNHFIEIGYANNDAKTVWIIVHSGSRNVGHKIATHYMKLASNSDKAKEWHYGFDVNTSAGQDYIHDLNFGLAFALENRLQIINRVIKAIQLHCSSNNDYYIHSDLINRNHNHAVLENGYWVHRKGATHAKLGMMGVIPGNMRDGSFIVRGKGNPDSMNSSSHGAGRVLSRKAAKETLNMEEFSKTMVDNKIVAKVQESTLDESPAAYKNIFEVMEMQKDLVEVMYHVKPLINIKG